MTFATRAAAVKWLADHEYRPHSLDGEVWWGHGEDAVLSKDGDHYDIQFHAKD